MKLKLFSLLVLFFIYPLTAESKEYTEMSNTELVNCLDTVISNENTRKEYINVKIQDLKGKLNEVTDNNERYWLTKNIYEEYSKINSDSAFVYANICLDLANINDNYSAIIDSKLNILSLYNTMGLFSNASDFISELSDLSLDEEQYTSLLVQMMLIQTNILKYNNTNNMDIQGHYYQNLRQYLNVLSENLDKDNPMYEMIMGWKVVSESDINEDKTNAAKNIILSLEDKIDKEYSASKYDPMYCYMVGTFYKYYGDKDKLLKYMLLTAIAEFSSGNLNMMTSALNEISMQMYDNDDLDHAFNYINVYSDIISSLNNKPAIVESENNKEVITQAYMLRSQQFQSRLKSYMIIMSILTILLLIALLFILRQMRCIKKQKQQLEEANVLTHAQLNQISQMHDDLQKVNVRLTQAIDDLSKNNDELNDINKRLDESNIQKEEYITQLFTVCTDYIAKIDDYRKMVSRKLKSGQLEDLKYTVSQTTMVEDSFKEFYQRFDEIFLNLYPDFIENINSLLLPDERISIKGNDRLNTETRIFALQRLGINDADKIAELLHCSVQTVYNSRQRMYKRTSM